MSNLQPLNSAERVHIEKMKKIKSRGPSIFSGLAIASILATIFFFLTNQTQYLQYTLTLLIISAAGGSAISLYVDSSYLTDYDFSPLELEQLRHLDKLKQEAEAVEKYLTKLSRFGGSLTQYDFNAIEKIVENKKKADLEEKLLQGTPHE